MRRPKIQCHNCAPKEWRNTPDMTGSYELDAVIMRNPNKDMADRLPDHLMGNDAYVIQNGYNSYTKRID